ncbi:hypothetical protein D3C71_425260 [compost metagenome]
MRRQGQTTAQRPDLVLDRRGAALGHADFCSGVVVVAQVGGVAGLIAAAQRHAEQVLHQRAGGVEVAAVHVSEAGVFLEGGVGAEGAAPDIAHLAGDDVDHAAHGVRTIESRDRTAHHFDALDGRHRRNEAGRGLAEAVRSDGAGGVLAATVDEDQSIVRRHAADGDVQAARLTRRGADINALDIGQGLGQALVAFAFQLPARQDADRGRGLCDALLEARGGDDDVGDGGRLGLVDNHLLRPGGLTRGENGQRRGGQQGRAARDGEGSHVSPDCLRAPLNSNGVGVATGVCE